MSRLEQLSRDLEIRQNRRMRPYEAAMSVRDIDEAYRNLRVAVRFKRKRDAAMRKAELRGENW